ncbi:MAG: WD40 repeat domain-containing protein [Minicystis sp.]
MTTRIFCDLQALSTCSSPVLAELLAGADWDAFDPPRDLPPLRARLVQIEREEGITAAHRIASERLLGDARLVVATRHRGAITAFALSPCGRYLATGGETPPFDYHAGGSLIVWEVETGRALRVFDPIDGGVGWSDNASCVQWSASGRWLGMSFSTNVVGVFDPFAGEPFLCEAGVTAGWDSPPAWCFAPDDERIFIAAWGPRSAPGCVARFADGDYFSENSDGLRWLSARPAGAEESAGDDEDRDDDIQPLRWVRWSPDGARVYGHGRGGQAYAIDTETGQLVYRVSAEAPVAWSPDGARLAHCPAGLVFSDGKTGLLTADVPMIVGAGGLVFSADGRRLALVVHADNGADAEPGVHIVEDGVVRGSLDVSPVKGSFMLLDATPFAFSPDGARGACLTTEGRVEIWSLAGKPERLLTIDGAADLLGLVWGAGEGLMGIGRTEVAFWDATTGALRARHTMVAPPGFAGPPMELGPYLGEVRVLPIPVEDGWAWSVFNDAGEMVCPPSVRDAVAPLASFVVADRFAWPWAWAAGSKRAPVYDDARAIPEGSPLRDRVRRERAERGAPFFTVEIGDPRPAGEDARFHHDERQNVLLRAELLSMELNTQPVTHYRATPILQGAAITKAALAPYVGRPVMMVESWRTEHVTIGVITALHDDYLSYYYESGRSLGSGSVNFSKLAWIGPAVPIDPA